MYTPFAHAFLIKQTPYAFVAKIILCTYLLYDRVICSNRRWSQFQHGMQIRNELEY